MKKKILTTVMACAMAVGLLSGCSFDFSFKQPTAEELLENGFPTDQSVRADMYMAFDADVDMGEEMGGAAMSISLSMDCNLQMDDDTMGMYGPVSMSFLGMSVNEEMATWVQKDGKGATSYDKDAETGTWYVSYGEATDSTGIPALDASVLDDLSVEKDKESGNWVVTGTADASDMDLPVSDGLSEFGMEEPDMVMQVRAEFNGKTKLARSVSMSVDPCEVDGAKINSFEFSIENITFFDEPVTVPADIVASAVAVESDFGGFDGDEGFTIDEDIPEGEEGGSGTDTGTVSDGGLHQTVSDGRCSIEGVIAVNNEGDGADIYMLVSDLTGSGIEATLNYRILLDDGTTRTGRIDAETEPGGKAAGYGYADTGAGIESVEMWAESSEPYNALYGSNIDVAWSYDPESGTLAGSITNNEDVAVDFAKLHIVCYDASGEMVYCSNTYASSGTVSAGGSAEFSTWMDLGYKAVPYAEMQVWATADEAWESSAE